MKVTLVRMNDLSIDIDFIAGRNILMLQGFQDVANLNCYHTVRQSVLEKKFFNKY